MAIAGLIAGCLEAIVTMPFEVVKTRQQISTTQGNNKPFSLLYKTNFRSLAGLKSFYTGLPVMMLQTGGKACIRFYSYDILQTHLGGNKLLSGTIAGCLEAALWITPCERLKILLIKHSNEPKKWNRIVQSLYSSGLRGTYQGTSATVIRNGASVGFRFVLFDFIQPYVNNAAASGAIVGAISTVLNNPVDVIKSKMQAETKGVSLVQVSVDLFKREGVLYLFKTGLGARLLKITIGQAVIFQTVDIMKKNGF
eukprot:maker-scaffold_78-snap-gene-0.5-mRNA-1 protein AED:0.01 eAED:0.01 QI:130/1/1/1/1/1/4/1211/252